MRTILQHAQLQQDAQSVSLTYKMEIQGFREFCRGLIVGGGSGALNSFDFSSTIHARECKGGRREVTVSTAQQGT